MNHVRLLRLATTGASAQQATPEAPPVASGLPSLPAGCTVGADGLSSPRFAAIGADGLSSPRFAAIGADGTVYVSENGFGGDEEFVGYTGRVSTVAPDGRVAVLVEGLAS